jgi:hypothetical protein
VALDRTRPGADHEPADSLLTDAGDGNAAGQAPRAGSVIHPRAVLQI